MGGSESLVGMVGFEPGGSNALGLKAAEKTW